MTTGRFDNKIIVTTNPDELRRLADKMEKKYPGMIVGDTCFVDFLVYQDDMRIDINLDQEWFIKNRPRRLNESPREKTKS